MSIFLVSFFSLFVQASSVCYSIVQPVMVDLHLALGKKKSPDSLSLERAKSW